MLTPAGLRGFLVFSCLTLSAAVLGAADPPPPAAALRSLTLYPAAVTLSGPRDEQYLGVLGEYSDGQRRDLSRVTSFRSSAPGVVRVENGVVRPVADGEALISVEFGGRTATVPVKVQGATVETPVNFTREVVPVLTRAGCNQGACHGAALGRGGFRLSLLGFDPAFEHGQIVQSAEGRRVVLPDPERSILLLKPTLTMEHGGG